MDMVKQCPLTKIMPSKYAQNYVDVDCDEELCAWWNAYQ